jgi:hypothetical protein
MKAEELKRVLVLGSAHYIPAWWDQHNDIYSSHTIVPMNNAWRVVRDREYYWSVSDDFDRIKPENTPKILEWPPEISTFYKNMQREGKAQYPTGTMLLNTLHMLIGWAKYLGVESTIDVAGSDFDYSSDRTHFYGKGSPDPLRFGLEWLVDELANVEEGSRANGCTIRNVGCYEPSLLPFEIPESVYMLKTADSGEILNEALTYMEEGCKILHIGAHKCEEWEYYKGLNPSKVTWVDPLPDREAFAELGAPNEMCEMAAVDTDIGEITMQDNGPFSSTLVMLTPQAATGHIRVYRGDQKKVKAGKLDSVLKPEYDLVVIDVQGGTNAVLDGAKEIMKAAKMAVIEIPSIKQAYHGESTVSEVYDRMYALGFGMWKFVSCCTQDGDALFVKLK